MGDADGRPCTCIGRVSDWQPGGQVSEGASVGSARKLWCVRRCLRHSPMTWRADYVQQQQHGRVCHTLRRGECIGVVSVG